MDLATPDDTTSPYSRLFLLLLPLCSGAMFLSALILFAIQPMFTKMILPLLGGTPAVWNTAVMFFQAVLLAGYLYAHLLSRLRRLRNQVLIHVAVLVVGLLFLPVRVGLEWTPTASTHPVPWLIALLAVSIGVPFFAISATAPLLQRWFSRSDHPHASDPYFLYVSSNIGGLAALLAYPTLVEPTFGLAQQGQLWTAGYALLAALIAGFALSLWLAQRGYRPPEIAEIVASLDTMPAVRSGVVRRYREYALTSTLQTVTWAMRARWVALAFVPSALLLAVTLHISTDVASAPFLWVAPLLLYSLSFVLVFARRPLLKHKWMLMLQPWVYALVALGITQTGDLSFILALHLLTLFVAAMVFHGELVRRRPVVEHLTEFYLWMSVGGLLGGVFCVLIAPVVFNAVLEYPLVLALSCLLLPSRERPVRSGVLKRDLHSPASTAQAEPARFVVASSDAIFMLLRAHYKRGLDLVLPVAVAAACFVIWQRLDLYALGKTGPILFFLALGLVLFLFRKRPLRFALAFSLLLFSTILLDEVDGRRIRKEGIRSLSSVVRDARSRQLFQARSFFGVYTVSASKWGNVHKLYHGTTLHGDQDMDEENLFAPRTYYDPRSPLAQVFEALRSVRRLNHVGVTGLGAGTLTCYQVPGQKMTFFEIDPTIERIARDPNLFRYLELRGQDVEVVIGDGRQSLARRPDGTFDLLVLDAFSSDAIPVHLLTREALAIYLAKLAPGGVILYHISNRYVDLEAVVANLALDCGAAALIQEYEPSSEDEETWDASSSTWVAVARTFDDLGPLESDDRWRPPDPDARVGVWTDDYS
ncbi:MAG: hypothetical protein FJ280_28235, partial [Planctomycetes bacterium]|nr:hypothetical protein [Planctomycetota bacterium]